MPPPRYLIAALAGVIAAIAIWGVPSASPTSQKVGTPYLGPPGGHGWMSSRPKPRSIVWAVGDGADGSQAAQNVASMIASTRVDRLLYLGDVYEYGTAQDFQANYRPLYGALGKVTAPTIGNHEWPSAETGYTPYWTAVDGAPPPLWYAFAVSGWQLISINSNLPESTAQRQWLAHLIHASPRYGNCRIAFMHHPVFSAGVHGDLEGFLAVMHPDTEFTPYEVAVQGGTAYHGREGMAKWWEESLEVLPDLRVQLDVVRDLGDKVFLRGSLRGHGAGSGAAIERPLWGLLEFRDGLQFRYWAFASESEALEAAGLSE